MLPPKPQCGATCFAKNTRSSPTSIIQQRCFALLCSQVVHPAAASPGLHAPASLLCVRHRHLVLPRIIAGRVPCTAGPRRPLRGAALNAALAHYSLLYARVHTSHVTDTILPCPCCRHASNAPQGPDDRCVALRSHHGRYLCVEQPLTFRAPTRDWPWPGIGFEPCSVVANREACDAWERLEVMGGDGVALDENLWRSILEWAC